MRIHRESKSLDDIINIFFLDQDNNVILEFEDKAHSMGSKIAVYDNAGYPVYLIDDTTSGRNTELTIFKDTTEAAKLQIADNFFAGYNVSIEAQDGNYHFYFMQRSFEKNGSLIAEIKPHPENVEALIDKDHKKTEKINLGIIKLLRQGKVSLLNHIDFDLHADDAESQKLYLTMLYAIQFLVVNKISSAIA